ncbi:Transcriptional activator somA [Paramyrothecium foliicola]|nr:Transcriptional activator somA [Paramyrothecium foliicola]
MAMNPNVSMANMNPMGGPVGGAPVPMMNNAGVNPQAAAAAAARQQQVNDSQRGILNTYIYEYFIRYGMYDCARSLLSSDQQVNVHKDGAGRRRDENGNVVNGVLDDAMDTDTKDDLDGKLPDDLPPPKLPMPTSDTSFLYEWFCLFWDIYNAQRAKGGNGTVNQYVSHNQQTRLKQSQQDMLRQMRPDIAQQQYQAQLMRMNGNMQMVNNSGALARKAMANNQNPQMQIMQAKQNPMQRDPSGMDANRGDRPSSPASGENAPSPSKRQRIDGAQFNPNQPGAGMPNGRPGQPMQAQQMAGNPNVAAAHQMLSAHGINPSSLNAQQFQNFANMTPAAQQKSIQAYSQNLQTHHGAQMGNKQMPNAGPPSQGSPMLPPGPDGNSLAAFYNPGEIAGPGGLRPGPGGAQQPGGSNHALQDYQMQLMLLEQQNKKRLMMARQEQDNIGGIPRDPSAPNAPGAPAGPIGQPFPDASPQAMRTGTSPNPTDQMKRGTPQMNNSGIPSPVPEGAQSRGSPNPALNFMGNHVDPNQAPHFFNKQGMEGNMAAAQQAQMNGMRAAGSHPGQPFNNQMTQQQMMARQQQQQQQPGAQGNPQQWQQQGPNGQMLPQGMQQSQPVQGTPQQRSMPPPSAPAAAGTNSNARTTASPQQAAAAPPTPNQSNKAAPKKKDNKNAKDKRATQKKSNPSLNSGATPAGDNGGEPEAPTPATPITPVNNGNFKPGQNSNGAPNGQTSVMPPTGAPGAGAGTGVGPTQPGGPTVSAPPNAGQVPPQSHGDPNQNGSISMDNFSGMVDFPPIEMANPLQTPDVLNDFDFDSFLHDDNGAEHFDFNSAFPGMENEGISTE